LLKAQYGVPDGIVDQLDNIARLHYREGWNDREDNFASDKSLEEVEPEIIEKIEED